MKRIAKFYTYFWILYFPVCVAFTSFVGFDYSDELMVIWLTAWAYTKQNKMIKDGKRRREISLCIGIFLFYLVYSFLIKVTTMKGVMLDILQEARPYAMFYVTWLLAPFFNKKQKKMILYVALASSLFYVYQFVSAKGGLRGALNEEDGGLSIVALLCAMLYYLFTKPVRGNAYIAVAIMLVGILSGKSKYYGECICFIALVFFVKNKINFTSTATYGRIIALVVAVLFFTWTKFNAYYVEGIQDEAGELARPMTYRTGMRILVDYFPFGSGYGSFATAAAAKEYSPLYYKYHLNHIWGLSPDGPMFLADCYYPTLAQFGVVGIFFFLCFWKRRIQEIQKIKDMQHYRMAWMVVLVFAIDSTANTGYLSSFGMGFFMILAICLNSNRYLFPEDDITGENGMLDAQKSDWRNIRKEFNTIEY